MSEVGDPPSLTLNSHQSEPTMSSRAGVKAAHHASPLMLSFRTRTLPSARPTTMPPGWAVAARVGSQLPSNGVGRDWNFDRGPIASGAPRFAKPVIANPVWKARGGRSMGGGCQGKSRAVQYAHAVPPSRNIGGIIV